jgi:hypothetical protein
VVRVFCGAGKRERKNVRRSAAIKGAVALNVLLGIGVILYWAAWWLAPGLVRSRPPSASDYGVYMAFENAFPLADLWVTITALVGALGLWRLRSWGLLSTLLSAGGAIFLALIDLLYDLQHAMILPPAPEKFVDLLIVLGLLAVAPLAANLAWSERGHLREGAPARRRSPRRTKTARR